MIKRALIILSSIPAAIGVIIPFAATTLLKQIDKSAIDLILEYGNMFGSMNTETTIIYVAAKIESNSFVIITVCAIWLFIAAYLWEISKEEVNVK